MTFKRIALAIVCIVVAAAAVYAVNAAVGVHTASRTRGVLALAGLSAPAAIVRDDRDIPHIRASNEHDAYFAEGYAQASDRLFQMDLLRRFVTGRLAEVMGAPALQADENARIVPISAVVAVQWQRMPQRERNALSAFSDGVNAAMQHEPLPGEFRLLLYKPEPWTPQDSLAAGFATVLDLVDRWDDVVRRDRVGRLLGRALQQDFYSVTDPLYDAPLGGEPAPVARLHRGPLAGGPQSAYPVPQSAYDDDEGRMASNEFALGASRSVNGDALLANDPHLRLGIPGVWYVVEIQAPGMHVAGVTLAGVPGVVLGHNENIAWGATNGTTVTEVVYADSLSGAAKRNELFHVRFGNAVSKTYLSTHHGFVIDDKRGYAVDWNAVRFPLSALTAFDGLNHAKSIADAVKSLRAYPGPPQNFVLADTSGKAAYHLVGLVPQDPTWGLRIHRASDPFYGFVPFDRLPHVDAAAGAAVFTANNRMYGKGYGYRLSSNFAAPYRAYRIRQLLQARHRLAIGDLFAIQSDTLSLPERELARDVLAAARRRAVPNPGEIAPALRLLKAWDGRFNPDSKAASLMYSYRRALLSAFMAQNTNTAVEDYRASAGNADIILLLRVLRENPPGWWPNNDYDAMLLDTLHKTVAGTQPLAPWRITGSVSVKHPLNSFGMTFLNGGILSGLGDAYSPHVQTNSPHSQSFRAVWDTKNWNAGGIIIPSGESGEPGSHHYTDQRGTWERQQLVPLPFSDCAVAAASRSKLVLTPQRKTP